MCKRFGDERGGRKNRLALNDAFSRDAQATRQTGGNVEIGSRGSGRGVESESETPKMVGVALFCTGCDDGDSIVGAGETLWLAKVFAEERIDGMANCFGFIGQEKAKGERFGDADFGRGER